MVDDGVEFEHVEGARREHSLRLYALSTCGFCKKAIEFLKSQNVKFEYLYLDRIDVEKKRKMKAALKEKYESIPVFPVLTIDDRKALSGFREEEYKTELGLE